MRTWPIVVALIVGVAGPVHASDGAASAIVVEAPTGEQFREIRRQIEARGAHVRGLLPRSVLLAEVPATRVTAILAIPGVRAVEMAPLDVEDPRFAAIDDPRFALHVRAWNAYSKATGGAAPSLDPLENDFELPPEEAAASTSKSHGAPYPGAPEAVSSYLVGEVVASLLFPESNFASTFPNWAQADLDWSLGNAMQGLDWLAEQSEGLLAFTYVIEVRPTDDPAFGTASPTVACDLETADRDLPAVDPAVFMSCLEYLARAEFDPAASPVENIYAYVRAIRDENEANWAVIVETRNASNRSRASGGPYTTCFLVGPSTYAHEVGHIAAGCADEYCPDVCPTVLGTQGYLAVGNANAVGPAGNGPVLGNGDGRRCVMATGDPSTLCAYTRISFGWSDRDGDGVPDLRDVPPRCLDVTYGNVFGAPIVSGTAEVAAHWSGRDTPRFATSTVNRIQQVECRLVRVRALGAPRRGPWRPAAPIDGAHDSATEVFLTVFPALPNVGGGTIGEWYEIECRAFDDAGNVPHDGAVDSTGAFQGLMSPGFNTLPLVSVAGEPRVGSLATTFRIAVDAVDLDGDPLSLEVSWEDGAPFAPLVDPTHAYATEGPKTITVRATDPDGGVGTANATVLVEPFDVPPVVVTRFVLPVGSDPATRTGDAVHGTTTPSFCLDVSAAKDAETASATLALAVEWGDGSVDAMVGIPSSPICHAYAVDLQSGTGAPLTSPFTIAIAVTDAAANVTRVVRRAWTSPWNHAPDGSVTPWPAQVPRGFPVNVFVAGSDPDEATPWNGELEARIDWESDERWDSPFLELEVAAALTHAYAKAGTHAIGWEIRDAHHAVRRGTSSVAVTLFPPAPVVDDVLPGALGLGTFDVVVTVLGHGFMPESLVAFDGDVAVTSVDYVSPTQMRVTISVPPTAALGTRTITVTNPDEPGATTGTSSSCACLDVLPTSPLAPPLPTLVSPAQLVRDWATEVVLTCGSCVENLDVRLLQGAEALQATDIERAGPDTFRFDVDVPAGAALGPWDLEVTNPDGQQAVAPGAVLVRRALMEPDFLWAPSPFFGSAAWADRDGDGDQDFVAISAVGVVGVFENDLVPSGTLAFTDVTAAVGFSAPQRGTAVRWLDHDNDGDLDIFACAPSGYPNGLYRDDGGVYSEVAAGTDLASTRACADAAVGDLDLDGYVDLVLANGGGQPVEVFLNAGDGRFRLVSVPWFGTTYHVSRVALLDVDGDCLLDLYASGGGTGLQPRMPWGVRDQLFMNEGGGLFGPNVAPDRGLDDARDAESMVVADLDQDGLADVFVLNAEYGSVLFRNRGDGSFEKLEGADAPLGDPGGRPHTGASVRAADFDSDGLLDLVVSRPLTFLRNTGSGFEDATREWASSTLVTSNSAALAAVGDLDADGDPDLALIRHVTANQADALTGNAGLALAFDGGAGCWGDGVDAVVAADLDGDTLAEPEEERLVHLGHGGAPGGDSLLVSPGIGPATAATVTATWQDCSTSTHAAVPGGVVVARPVVPVMLVAQQQVAPVSCPGGGVMDLAIARNAVGARLAAWIESCGGSSLLRRSLRDARGLLINEWRQTVPANSTVDAAWIPATDGFVVAHAASASTISADVYDALGQPDPAFGGPRIVVDTTPRSVGRPGLAGRTTGGFVVAWDTGGLAARWRSVSATGSLGSISDVSASAASAARQPVVAARADGSFAIAWASTGFPMHAYVRSWSAAGVPSTGDVQVDTMVGASFTVASVRIDELEGDVLVSWLQRGLVPGSPTMGTPCWRRFTPALVPIDSAQQFVGTTPFAGGASHGGFLGDGSVVVAWERASAFQARRFGSNAAPLAPAFPIVQVPPPPPTGAGTWPIFDLVTEAGHHDAIAWVDPSTGASDPAMVTERRFTWCAE